MTMFECPRNHGFYKITWKKEETDNEGLDPRGRTLYDAGRDFEASNRMDR